MKKIYTTLVFLCAVAFANGQVVNIPDVNFKLKLLSANTTTNQIAKDLNGNWTVIDTNNDNLIQQSEANNVSSLDLRLSSIQNITGIKSFINLISIDLSNYHPEITSGQFDLFNFLTDYTQILDFGNMTHLENIVTEGSVNKININGCSNLKKFIVTDYSEGGYSLGVTIEYNITDLQNLEEINLINGGNIDFSQLTHLKKLFIISKPIVNLTNLSLLEEIYLSTGPNSNDFIYGPIEVSLTLPIVKTSLKRATIDVATISSLNFNDFINLEYLDLYASTNYQNPAPYGNLTNLSLTNCNKLKTLNISRSNLTIFNYNLPLLENLDCSKSKIKEIDLNNCPLLNTLNCSNSDLKLLKLANTSLENQITFLPNTKLNFICADSIQVPSLQYQVNLASLENQITVSADCNLAQSFITIDIADINFKNKLIALGVDTNNDLKIQKNEALSLTSLNLSNSEITDLTGIEYFTHLTSLDCSSNTISYLNLASLTELNHLNFSNNSCVFIDLSKLINLQTINASNNQLRQIYFNNNVSETSFDFSGNSKLHTIITDLNQFAYFTGLYPSAQISNIGNFVDEYLPYMMTYLSNALNTLTMQRNVIYGPSYFGGGDRHLQETRGLERYTNLESFSTNSMGGNHVYYGITPISCIESFIHLESLSVIQSPLLPINFQLFSNLKNLTLSTDIPNLETIDLNSNLKLEQVYLGVGNKIFLNNGINENLSFLENYNHTVVNESGNVYLCVDDFQTTTFHAQYPSANINSYCSFTPGGNYNTISGNALYDNETNGCDTNDASFEFLRVNMTDGTNSGSTFTNFEGDYAFFMNNGTFTLTPQLENPTYFNVSPVTTQIAFANNNNNTASQDFCITPNGTHNDLEVVLAQVTPARPGFDAEYRLIYKNKGNQPLSGAVSVTFDDAKSDFVSASVVPTSNATGSLSWNYSNLLPFENRSIAFTLNVNTPTETPAVNNGDILAFNAQITPLTGDEVPADNVFVYNQTVVGSFDPNDIYCLEGGSLDPSMIGNYLHYNVRFENTGTAAAENIVVATTINPAEYDLSSLQVMNASHNVYTRLNGNLVEFIFENIQLAGSPSGGHGHVLFKMKSNPNVQTTGHVTSNANIFFDYNFPIETNDATTVFETLRTNDNDAITVQIYPNPTKDQLHIQSQEAIKKLDWYDIGGRILESISVDAKEVHQDLSQRASGIYFVKLKTEKGSKTLKIIKE